MSNSDTVLLQESSTNPSDFLINLLHAFSVIITVITRTCNLWSSRWQLNTQHLSCSSYPFFSSMTATFSDTDDECIRLDATLRTSKGKLFPVYNMQPHWGSRNRPLFLNLSDWLTASPGCFTHKTEPNTHWIGGWMGLRDSLDIVEELKIYCPFWDMNSRQSNW
jgi:hypothetical protein